MRSLVCKEAQQILQRLDEVTEPMADLAETLDTLRIRIGRLTNKAKAAAIHSPQKSYEICPAAELLEAANDVWQWHNFPDKRSPHDMDRSFTRLGAAIREAKNSIPIIRRARTLIRKINSEDARST